jgi:hypothetical protein
MRGCPTTKSAVVRGDRPVAAMLRVLAVALCTLAATAALLAGCGGKAGPRVLPTASPRG